MAGRTASPHLSPSELLGSADSPRRLCGQAACSRLPSLSRSHTLPLESASCTRPFALPAALTPHPCSIVEARATNYGACSRRTLASSPRGLTPRGSDGARCQPAPGLCRSGGKSHMAVILVCHARFPVDLVFDVPSSQTSSGQKKTPRPQRRNLLSYSVR